MWVAMQKREGGVEIVGTACVGRRIVEMYDIGRMQGRYTTGEAKIELL
jgi:hypothetical protein